MVDTSLKDPGEDNMWHELGILYYRLKGNCKSLYQTEKTLRAYQSNKIDHLLERTSHNIHFYQSYKHATLYEYPIIDKSFVQEHFAGLNRLNISAQQVETLANKQKSTIEIHQSLGTSGIPGTYLYTVREKIASLGNMLGKVLPIFFMHRKRIAVFHLSSTPYLATKIATSNMNWLLLDLNQPFQELVSKLQMFNPEVLIGSVQTLCELAKLQHMEKISLHCHKIISTAEVLTPLAKLFIKSAFQQDVIEVYQCAEGTLGMTCQYGTMHLNEDEFYIEKEWIDHKQQRFVPVITTLKRTLQPLIRYRMEDILVLKKSLCRCGNPFMAVDKIVGRCEDVLYFKEVMHSGLKPIYADTLNQLFFSLKNKIFQHQVLQDSMHHIIVKLLAENFLLAKAEILPMLCRLWELEGVEPPVVEFADMDPIALNKMFKTSKRLE